MPECLLDLMKLELCNKKNCLIKCLSPTEEKKKKSNSGLLPIEIYVPNSMLEFLQQKHHRLTSGQYVPYMFDCFMLGNIDTVLIMNIKRLQRLFLTPKL